MKIFYYHIVIIQSFLKEFDPPLKKMNDHVEETIEELATLCKTVKKVGLHARCNLTNRVTDNQKEILLDDLALLKKNVADLENIITEMLKEQDKLELSKEKLNIFRVAPFFDFDKMKEFHPDKTN